MLLCDIMFEKEMIDLKIKNLKKKNRIIEILLVIVMIAFIIHTAYEAISLYNCIECSAPWHVAVVFNLAIYSLPIIVIVSLKIYFGMMLKRGK